MTLPRIVTRGACIFITRRCFGRQFLLRPDPQVVALFTKALSKAAAQHGVTILGAVQMSNHYHVVVHDRHGRYPEFVGWMNAQLTRGVNRLRGREDTLWEARQTSVVELGDAESVLEALAYVHLNPMAAGLVADPVTWPGLVTGPDDLEPEADAGRGEGGRAGRLEIGVPPTHARLSRGQFAALLRQRIQARSRWIRTALERHGRTFGTPEDALKVAWQAAPSRTLGQEHGRDEDALLEAFWRRVTELDEGPGPHGTGEATVDEGEPFAGFEDDRDHAGAPGARARQSSINPTVKAASAKRRAGMLTRLRDFREAYAKALQKFRKCLKAVFPGGTWRLCRMLNLPSGPAPSPAWMLA